VRPKNCAHRYCLLCFKKCFQDKQDKVCATCRTPILSVSKRGYTQVQPATGVGCNFHSYNATYIVTYIHMRPSRAKITGSVTNQSFSR
jgi:hypothetical protein